MVTAINPPNFIKSLSVKSSAIEEIENADRTANSPLNGTLTNKRPGDDRLSNEIEYLYYILHKLYRKLILLSVDFIR